MCIFAADFEREITKRYTSILAVRNVRNSMICKDGMTVHVYSVDCFQFYISGQFSRPLTGEMVYSATLSYWLFLLAVARAGVRTGIAAAYLQRITMKMKYLLGTMLMTMALGMTFSSCQKENDSTGIEMRLRNENNGGGNVDLLFVDDATHRTMTTYGYPCDYYESNSVRLWIDVSNNFSVEQSSETWLWSGDISITCVGNVGGLGKINKIPESGWTNSVAVNPGKGYIIRHRHDRDPQYCKYAKVYVVDWIEGTSGGIIGAVIRYEDNWKEE